MARAVYSGLDVLILDDVLSGLDPETSNTVWQNLCGVDGLLRRERRTVVFSSVSSKSIFLYILLAEKEKRKEKKRAAINLNKVRPLT